MINSRLLTKYLKLREAVFKKFSRFHHVEFLEGENILVLSPHPDDDVLGCGGTLAKHIKQGHSIWVAYLCGGNKGMQGINGGEAANIRMQEAKNSAQILGIPASNLIFFGQPDDGLMADSQTVERLSQLIAEVRPSMIYLPSFVDNHPDHFAANLLLKAVNPARVFISAYEIWTPLIPNRIVNISGEMELKKQTISAHKSQLEALDYLDGIVGLNQYRGCMYPKLKIKYAEAFCFAESDEYLSLFD